MSEAKKSKLKEPLATQEIAKLIDELRLDKKFPLPPPQPQPAPPSKPLYTTYTTNTSQVTDS